MMETALTLVPQYGVWLLALTTFLSCLALPVPSSIFMLTAGGFVAVGDLVAWQVMAGAFGGAVLGDQTGYAMARVGRRGLPTRIAGNPAMARASTYLERRGFFAVFLSRWLFAPLGPYMNFAAGLTAQNWRIFLVAGAAGEVLWVTLYVGLGMRFADDLVALADILGNASGLLAALAVLVAMALYLKSALARRGRNHA